MSILDLGFDTQEEFIKRMETAGPLMERVLDEAGLSNNKIIEYMKEGIPPYKAYGLTKDHLDALFATGITMMQAGEVQKAQDTFLKLTMLNNMDPRFNYALGTTFQAQGQYAVAAKSYLFFLALDATNVDGYLRVGECLLGSNEIEEALDTFETALALCENGHGTADNKILAEKMVLHTKELQGAAS